jgi:hypothetical protein
MQNFVTKIFEQFGINPDLPETYVKLISEGYMPLVIEREWTGRDDFKVFSVAHFYIQYGDVMYDPIIKFWVNPKDGLWYPFYYGQDGLGIAREYVEFEDYKPTSFYSRRQHDLASFCRTWSVNLNAQGFDCAKVEKIVNSDPSWEKPDFIASSERILDAIDELEKDKTVLNYWNRFSAMTDLAHNHAHIGG